MRKLKFEPRRLRVNGRWVGINEYTLVVDMFLTTHNNITSVIAKKLNLKLDIASAIINDYLSRRKVCYSNIEHMPKWGNSN